MSEAQKILMLANKKKKKIQNLSLEKDLVFAVNLKWACCVKQVKRGFYITKLKNPI